MVCATHWTPNWPAVYESYRVHVNKDVAHIVPRNKDVGITVRIPATAMASNLRHPSIVHEMNRSSGLQKRLASVFIYIILR